MTARLLFSGVLREFSYCLLTSRRQFMPAASTFLHSSTI